jgi:hypothetical protein
MQGAPTSCCAPPSTCVYLLLLLLLLLLLEHRGTVLLCCRLSCLLRHCTSLLHGGQVWIPSSCAVRGSLRLKCSTAGRVALLSLPQVLLPLLLLLLLLLLRRRHLVALKSFLQASGQSDCTLLALCSSVPDCSGIGVHLQTSGRREKGTRTETAASFWLPAWLSGQLRYAAQPTWFLTLFLDSRRRLHCSRTLTSKQYSLQCCQPVSGVIQLGQQLQQAESGWPSLQVPGLLDAALPWEVDTCRHLVLDSVAVCTGYRALRSGGS